MEGNDKKSDVDSGYAWVILAGCYITYLIIVGSVKTYGILFTELDEYYNVGSGPVAIVGSLLFLLMFSVGPVANYLAVKTSFRKVAIAGSLLLAFGYGVSAFIEKLELLFLTIGVCAGLGYGLTFTPCSTIISFYFEKRRALANGITVSASGIGSIAFSFLYKYLIETYALKPCLLIIGGILLNVCVAACLFRQPESLIRQKRDNNARRNKKSLYLETLLNGDIETSEEETTKKCSCGIDFKFSLFGNPRFTLYWIAFMISVAGYGNNLILIPSQIRTLGYGKRSVSTAVAITGGSEIVARMFAGWLADKKWIGPKYIFIFCYFVSAVFTFITPHINNIYYMFAYAAVIGLFPASFWSLVSVLVIDVVGMDDFPPAYGLVLPGLAIGLAISQVSIGWIKDQTGNWELSYYVTAMLLLIPAIMMLIEPLILPRNKKPEKETDGIDKVNKINDIDKVDAKEKLSNSSCKVEREHSHDKETESLLGDEQEITKHRSSKIYKAYNSEQTKAATLDRISAPLAAPESI